MLKNWGFFFLVLFSWEIGHGCIWDWRCFLFVFRDWISTIVGDTCLFSLVRLSFLLLFWRARLDTEHFCLESGWHSFLLLFFLDYPLVEGFYAVDLS